MFSKKNLKAGWLTVVLLILAIQANAQKQFNVLLITETDGWHHESIEDGIDAVEDLAARHNFGLERQQEAQKITAERLNAFDAVIFLNTTADIFDEQEQEAFENFIEAGNGYVGVHAASDTEYDWEWYTKLVGRMFHIHPVQQTARLDILEHNFPGLEHFPEKLLWTDEWYEFGEEKTSGLNYLVAVDENSYDPEVTWKNRDKAENGQMQDRVGKGMGDFHPISWYHEYDGGRAFYTALGHIPEIYKNQWFLDHLYGGIYYAATGKGIEE
ncbi:ThuA domain-containing protein [Zunongwangia sp. H14]|uniref:ThuA domain-containing protein n=1 Tax=Zunongwangia sp. H14 TaxID=3240792 RepID=UPI003564201D